MMKSLLPPPRPHPARSSHPNVVRRPCTETVLATVALEDGAVMRLGGVYAVENGVPRARLCR